MNIFWTLVTGFLVMFMQAGFALVETGLTRAKNVGPHDGDELRASTPSACSASGSAASPSCSAAWARSSTMDGPDILDKMWLVHARRQAVRPPRLQGLLPRRAGQRRVGPDAVPVPDGVHGHRGDDPDRGDGRALEVLGVLSSTASSCRWSSTRSSAAGSGAAAGWPTSAPTSAWATATSTSPARAWCT